MLLNKHIGGDSGGIDGMIFARELFEIDANNPDLITIYVNTLGGDVREGYEIMNAISSAKSKTKVVINGFAYSTGGWCILGADIIEAMSHSSSMYHPPHATKSGENSDFMEVIANSIYKILSGKSGRNGKSKKTEAEVKALMDAQTFWNAEQMLENGFVDKVTNSFIQAPEGDLDYQYQHFQNILNQVITKNTEPMNFPKVINMLGLVEGSSEDSVIAEIARRQNEFNALNQAKLGLDKKIQDTITELSSVKNELQSIKDEKSNIEQTLSEKESALSAANSTVDNLQSEIQKLKDEKLAAENQAKEDAAKALELEAKNLVQKYKELGKIKDDEEIIKEWEKMAVDNFAGTKTILETMPVSVSLPKAIPASQINNNKPAPGSFEALLAENYQELEATGK